MKISADERQTVSPVQKPDKERSRRYLRFWMYDYPYLNGPSSRTNQWLPVPENSPAQRFLRNLARDQIKRSESLLSKKN